MCALDNCASALASPKKSAFSCALPVFRRHRYRSNMGSPITYEIIAQPSKLRGSDLEELTEAFCDVSIRASSFGARSYMPAVCGWRAYYSDTGRPDRFDLIGLARNHSGHVIAIVAYKNYTIAGKPVCWWQTTLTLPEYQGAGVTKDLLRHVITAEFAAQYCSGYFVIRTPNPVVYTLAQSMARYLSTLGFQGCLYPRISDSQRIEPVPSAVMSDVRAILAAVASATPFDEGTFVLSGYYRKYGQLYRHYEFDCADPMVRNYFKANTSAQGMDGLFLLMSIEKAVPGGQSSP